MCTTAGRARLTWLVLRGRGLVVFTPPRLAAQPGAARPATVIATGRRNTTHKHQILQHRFEKISNPISMKN